MPHIHIKIAGQTEEQKSALAKEITMAIMRSTQSGEDTISVAIEDIAKEDWTEKVYKPDILKKWDILYKKPGYDPLK